ncbi:uncharacterized protein LOC118467513 [Anopheles albimanus]|uniref:uncharacterized protein LOC118467513 n=1 Tax=Anopheles albimanus TaxID=7167 RepID=UPI00163FFD6E|nr:uncharacterized protein LOC118467513 [Anopheles albimanus]
MNRAVVRLIGARVSQRKMNKPMKKRQKGAKPVVDEIEVAGKNLRDEALKYMKVRNYTKALGLYDQNYGYFGPCQTFNEKAWHPIASAFTPRPEPVQASPGQLVAVLRARYSAINKLVGAGWLFLSRLAF